MKFLSLMLTLLSFNSIAAEIGCPNAEAELIKDEERIEQSRSSADEQLAQIAEFEAQNIHLIEVYQSHLDYSQLDANTRPKYQKYVNEAKESLLEIEGLREEIANSEEQLKEYELKSMKHYRESCIVETRINAHSRVSEETTKLSIKVQKEAKLRNLCKEMNKG